MQEYESLIKSDKKLIVARASSKLEIETLIAKISAANTENHVIQVFDPAIVACREHLIAAYYNAHAAFEEGTQRTKSIAKEMLLYVALTPQISRALAKAGIRSTRLFVMFTDSKDTIKMLGSAVELHGELETRCSQSDAALGTLGIDKGDNALVSLLEAMAKVKLHTVS